MTQAFCFFEQSSKIAKLCGVRICSTTSKQKVGKQHFDPKHSSHTPNDYLYVNNVIGFGRYYSR